MTNQIGSAEQEKIWLAAATARPLINVACTASRQMVEDHLDEHLLPANLQNILAAVDALDAVGRLPRKTGQAPATAPAPVTPAIDETSEEEKPIDLRKLTVGELRALIRRKNSNQLPDEFTRERIRSLSAQAYERLAITYGSHEVRNRLKGIS